MALGLALGPQPGERLIGLCQRGFEAGARHRAGAGEREIEGDCERER